VSLCTGASERKPSSPSAFYATPDYLAALLPVPLAPLAPFVSYIPPINIFDVDAYCGSDPPGVDFTGLTLSAILAGGEIGASIVAVSLITQMVNYYLWFALCQCHSGPAATPAAPPALPSPIPAINPPGIVTTLPSSPCKLIDIGPTHFPPGASTAVIGTGTTASFTTEPLPAGATQIIIKTTNTSVIGTPSAATNWVYRWLNGAGVQTTGSGFTPSQTPNSVETTRIAVPSDATSWFMEIDPPATPNDIISTAEIGIYCGTSGPGTTSSPCDPCVTAALSKLMEMVTLIQRQSVPFGYVYGANHAGLTGHGSFAVSDLLGVSVDVTTLPSVLGQSVGSPVEYFDVGYVTLGTADGYETSRRIDHDGTLLVPPQAGVFTAVGYTLHDGVTASIRELVREP
jgi:hypothetical protein